MTELSGSASFEPGIELSEPSAKRARFEPTDLAPEPVTEIAVTEDAQPGDEEVHLTVPQTQFEIEINSGSVEDEDGVVRETILQQDLSGPAFAITTASQVAAAPSYEPYDKSPKPLHSSPNDEPVTSCTLTLCA